MQKLSYHPEFFAQRLPELASTDSHRSLQAESQASITSTFRGASVGRGTWDHTDGSMQHGAHTLKQAVTKLHAQAIAKLELMSGTD